jgi:hypothetical protein
MRKIATLMLALVIQTAAPSAMSYAKGGSTATQQLPIYDCFVAAHRAFSDHPITANITFCQPLMVEPGWELLRDNTLMVILYRPDSLQKDEKGASVRSRIYTADTLTVGKSPISFDRVEANYQFDCAARTQKMSDVAYSNRGQASGQMDPAELQIETVPPSSPSDMLLQRACFERMPTQDIEARKAPTYDSEFVCPELIAEEAAQKQSLQDFTMRMAKANPNMTIADFLQARIFNLGAHKCQRTLNYIANHQQNAPANNQPTK